MSFIIQEQASPVLFEIGKEEPTGAGGTIDFYLNDQDFLYFEGNASANFAIDLAFDAATTLDDALSVDDLITITLAVKNGLTPYYLTNFQIDGGAGAITINWQGGVAPTSGTSGKIDSYIFRILKTSGNAYTIFASVSASEFLAGATKGRKENLSAGGEINYYISQQNDLIYTQAATSDYSLNVSFATGVSLISAMSVGEEVSIRFASFNNASAHYLQTVSIDGTQDGISYSWASAVPTTGFTSAMNNYDLTILKTNAQDWSITLDQAKYAPYGTVPDAPTLASATIASPSAVTVTFSATQELFYPNLSYTVISSPSSITGTSSSSPVTVDGLTPSATYSFQVFASNILGDSLLSSATNSVVMVQNPPTSVEMILVAGGGGGGTQGSESFAGGGGAGGYLYSSVNVSTATVYNVTVGTGGAARTSGTNSTAFGFTAIGGGGGGDFSIGVGKNGGSGGGGGANNSGSGYAGGTGTAGPPRQGYDGGTGATRGQYAGSGGGASQAGVSSPSSTTGKGGDGTAAQSIILQNANAGVLESDNLYWIAAGGNTGQQPTNLIAKGGGGRSGTPPVANTGSGGAGANPGQTGANGILIIAYSQEVKPASVTTGSPTVIVSGGYRIYKFTGNGSIRWD